MKYFALLGALLVALGCSGSDHGGAFVDPGGDSGGSGGRTSSHAGAGGKNGTSGSGGRGVGEAGEAGAAGAEDVLAPIVSITSPVLVSDPNKGAVVTGDTVVVLCDASASNTPGSTIDAQTVKIEAFDAKGVAIGTPATASTQNALDPNEYSATFSLVKQSNGPVSFKCSASDKSTPPTISTATISTF